MTCTVVWTPTAEADLTRIWLDAADKLSITTSVHSMDVLLRRQPLEQGESRDGDTRIAFVAPLGFQFEVVQADRSVFVLGVWRIDRRS